VASGQRILASYGANLPNVTSRLKLPFAVQSYLDNALGYLSGVTEYLQSATGYSTTTLFSALVAILVITIIPALTVRNKQTGKKGIMSRYSLSRGGYSPYDSTLSHVGIPAVTDEDYSYITSEDLESFDTPRAQSRRHHHDTDHFSHSTPSFDHRKPADDVMLIKHNGVIYPERFPAYSIGDGKLQVDDVLQRVELVLRLTPREARGVRLFYKGRRVRDPRAPIRDYGVKNNSEVLVMIGEPIGESGGSDSSEEIVVVGRDEPEETNRPKPEKSRRGRRQDERSPRSSNFSLEVPTEDRDRRSISRVRTQSPSSLSAVSGASAAAGVPGGPIEKMNSIASHFNTKLRPLCEQYLAKPPSDRKKNEDEHRKISETVMQQVLLKLDEVDTSIEEGARARRKELVQEVQGTLKKMDDTLNSSK